MVIRTPPATSRDGGPWWDSAANGPSCIQPPRPDGATTFSFNANPDLWATASRNRSTPELYLWAMMVDRMRAATTSDEDKLATLTGGIIEYLPISNRQMPARSTVYGTRRQHVILEVVDRVRISINLETGRVRLEFRAKELWSGPWEDAFSYWVCALHLMFTGEEICLASAYASGWKVTALELCADFVSFTVGGRDRPHFVTQAQVIVYDKTGTASEPVDTEMAEWSSDSIYISSRANDVSIFIYNKTVQVNKHKRGANSCNYVAAWQAGGWDGEICPRSGLLVGPDIRRVELRLKGRGLELILKADSRVSKATKYNLRDPFKVCNLEILGVAWVHMMTKTRLIVPAARSGDEITRKERCPTDRRWEVVQNAGFAGWPHDSQCTNCQEGRVADGLMCACVAPELKQSRRMMDDARREKIRRASLRVSKGLAQLEALLCVKAEDDVAFEYIARFARHFTRVECDVDLDEYQRGYAKLIRAYIGPEIDREGRPQMLKFCLSERTPPPDSLVWHRPPGAGGGSMGRLDLEWLREPLFRESARFALALESEDGARQLLLDVADSPSPIRPDD